MSTVKQNQNNFTKVSIAIVGAGLSGLALAQSLLKAGFDVQVYEREPSAFARRQGYRITVDQNGTKALRECLPSNLFELFLATASSARGKGYFRFTNQKLREIFKLTFNLSSRDNNDNAIIAGQTDRQTLRTILLSGIQDRVHFNKAAIRVEDSSEGATLFFQDGSSTRASLVVGADGAHSVLREQVLPECPLIDIHTVGIYGRSALIQNGFSLLPKSLENSGVLSIGDQGNVFFFTAMRFHESPITAFARLAPDQQPPVNEDYIMWAFLFPKGYTPADFWNRDATTLHKLALEATHDFHPLLQKFVASADIDYTIPVALSAATRPKEWQVSRVTLMGDAIHLMPPFGAHGGNTALRDAALLSEKLQEAVARGEPLEDAVRIYQEEMIRYSFREVEAAKTQMNRVTSNPIMRWIMLRSIPALRSFSGKSLAG